MASDNDVTTHYQNEAPLLFEKGSPGTPAVSLPRSDVPGVDRNEAVGTDL